MADPSLIGYTFPAFRFVVEEGKIAEFAKAILCSDPCFFDAGAARQNGYRAQPAPPTFSTAAMHWQPPQEGNPLDLDLTRVLAGGNEWEYLKPVVAGDAFTVRSHIADVSRRHGSKGEMTFIVKEMHFYDADEQLALIARSTIIELPPTPPLEASKVLPT